MVLSCDIGGSLTKLGLVNRSGEIVAFREVATIVSPGGLDLFVNMLLFEMDALLEQVVAPIIGIGVAFLGWINEECTGPFFCMNAPALHGYNFKAMMEKHFHLPVAVHDDVTAHTLAEFRFGVGQGARRFLCLAMGTGLGAGMMVDGKPLNFTGGCAGDTGHVILRPGGPQCSSGCRGCGEALIGVAGIERLGEERFGVRRHARAWIEGAARQDDSRAVDVMREIGSYTGELLASLFPIFTPERIALVGGTAHAGPVLLEAARERFDFLAGGYCRTFFSLPGNPYGGVEIVTGTLDGESGVIGAAADFF